MGEPLRQFILGIDLGSASLGWALLGVEQDGPRKIISAGVRLFDPGVAGNLEQGQDESKNKDRREARLHRRQVRRKAARQRELFELLQSADMLPAERSVSDRHYILQHFDEQLWARWKERMLADSRVKAAADVVPYFLRARALDHKLDLHELGRVLYHLGQRRGFKSNRKAEPKKDEKPGEVAQGISELNHAMKEAGARTLGEYFISVNPATARIRGRWSERAMYTLEFEAIWNAQATHYPEVMTPELKDKIQRPLFFQRPLQDNEHLVGRCELEPDEKRAPWATLAAQRFRLLQRLNDLELEEASGTVRRLTEAERNTVLKNLEDGDQTFANLRTLIGIKARDAKFTLERGGEKNCRGDRTTPRMRRPFGPRWDTFPRSEQDRIVEEWRTTQEPQVLIQSGIEKWGLSQEQAELWSREVPEPGYCGFSRVALEKLLPHLELGVRLNAAIKVEYPERSSGGEIYDLLPPLGDVRNPAINRAMSELRKLVNAIIRKYGKPRSVHIELARDLKKSREDRKRIWKEQRSRETNRAKAAIKVLGEVGGVKASRPDIEKYMLAEECGWVCPYTGKEISMRSLFTAPEFQVEHILPLSRFPDNSFLNKTLCHVSANAEKANRTPYEAFHADEERWAQIMARAKKFDNPTKLRRFQLGTEESGAARLLEDFSARQLNDTRYNCKLAADFLGKLYGGRDEDGKRKVFATSGGVTATLRRVWGLESILGHGEGKGRHDHRHHAVDAIVIGLTSQSVIQRMSEAASRNYGTDANKEFRAFKGMEQPWKDFVDSARPHIEGLKVSHRPNHKLSGALHEETLYGKPYVQSGKSFVNVRKPLRGLSAGDIENIVDPAVRKAVRQRLDALGGDIEKLKGLAPEEADLLPFLTAKDGRRIPIRRVRIRKAMSPTVIGRGARERFVQPGNNHHVEIFSKTGGKARWEGVPVPLLEAMERHRKKQPIIAKRYLDEADWEFQFSLMGGDTIELMGMEGDLDRTGIWRVRTIASNEQLALVRAQDARLITEIKKAGQWWQPRPDALRRLNARKVEVDLLGKAHYVNEGSAEGVRRARA